MRVVVLIAVLLAAFLPRTAPAEVLSAADGGFVVQSEHTVKATPAEAWAGLVDIGSWWHHAFSGDPSNFTLSVEPGGAWIEHLPDGGFVEHMRVVFAQPGKQLILRGSLGPLIMEAATATLLFGLEPAEEGTKVTVTYKVAGYHDGGLGPWAPVVDRVVGEAAARLARRIETGSAE